MIRAVFFDLYNTLIRYEPSREESHARALQDISPGLKPEAFCRPLAAADEYIYQEMARTPWGRLSGDEKAAKMAEFERIVLREVGIDPTEEVVKQLLDYSRRHQSRLALFDDVLPAFGAIRDRGLLLGLISNAESSAYKLIDELGLKQWLQIVVTSEAAGFTKPDPRIFQAALERAKVGPSEAVYVGDQYRVDIVGAQGAGMKAILIDRGGCFDHVKGCPVIRTLLQVTEQLIQTH